jgi:hypothetical protein
MFVPAVLVPHVPLAQFPHSQDEQPLLPPPLVLVLSQEQEIDLCSPAAVDLELGTFSTIT